VKLPTHSFSHAKVSLPIEASHVSNLVLKRLQIFHRLITTVTFATRVSIVTCHCRWKIARDRFTGHSHIVINSFLSDFCIFFLFPFSFSAIPIHCASVRLLSLSFQLAVSLWVVPNNLFWHWTVLKASLGFFNFPVTDRSWSEYYFLYFKFV